MNATNRGVNRTVLALVGLLLIAAGGAVATAALWAPAGDAWKSGGTAALEWMVAADEAFRVSEATTLSWLTLALLALLLVLVIIAIAVVARLGGGRSAAVIRADAGEGPQGSVTIQQGFASDAIAHSLSAHDDILASRVNARRMRGEEVLHISVTPRQHTSPVEVATTVVELVDNLAALTGRATPTFVSVHSGIRSRLASDRSRVD